MHVLLDRLFRFVRPIGDLQPELSGLVPGARSQLDQRQLMKRCLDLMVVSFIGQLLPQRLGRGQRFGSAALTQLLPQNVDDRRHGGARIRFGGVLRSQVGNRSLVASSSAQHRQEQLARRLPDRRFFERCSRFFLEAVQSLHAFRKIGECDHG